MNKTVLISSFLGLIGLSVACTIDYAPSEMPRDSYGINSVQAELYASMYAPLLSNAENGGDESTKATSGQEKILEDIDYLIENGDTLMYAFNYQNDGGYIMNRVMRW